MKKERKKNDVTDQNAADRGGKGKGRRGWAIVGDGGKRSKVWKRRKVGVEWSRGMHKRDKSQNSGNGTREARQKKEEREKKKGERGRRGIGIIKEGGEQEGM